MFVLRPVSFSHFKVDFNVFWDYNNLKIDPVAEASRRRFVFILNFLLEARTYLERLIELELKNC